MAKQRQFLLVWWTGDPRTETPRRHQEIHTRKRNLLSHAAVHKIAGLQVAIYEWWAGGWVERKWI